jgi:UDP-N-acetylglucosamine 1-carboxyvinyltransferase
MQNSTIERLKTSSEPILEIEGGTILNGSIQIEGAKNAALPALVASLLSDESVILTNVPVQLNDIKRIVELMRSMGADVVVDENNKTITLHGSNWTGGELDGDIAGSIRHSLLLLGLSVAWKKDLKLPIPGGCKLGTRKHDMHIDALEKLGNLVVEDEGINVTYRDSKDEVDIEFYYPTFGGTFNAIFASVKKVNKVIRIHNAAKNPEVIDVISMLKLMGADISWESERVLIIKGVEHLKGISYSIMPDRIVGATVISAAGITKGNVKIQKFDEELLTSEISAWREAGLIIEQVGEDLIIDGANSKLKAIDIETKAYPGFHTDVQPLHVLLMTVAEGNSAVKETILDGRFKYCKELEKLGANIEVIDGNFKCVNGAQGQIAKISGVKKLKGATVKATDIRGGAAVAVAGLLAEGQTIVTNLYQLERGYGNFVEMFNELGANIKRLES